MESESVITPAPRAPLKILPAMLTVMKQVEAVRRDRKGPGYKFSGHNDVTEALRDAFIEAGIVQSFTTRETNLSQFGLLMTVVVRWTHVEDGSYKECEVPGICEPILNKDGKNVRPMDLGTGVAISYAVKYAQLKTFMLIAADVLDAEQGRSVDRQPEQRRDEPRKPSGEPPSGEQLELLVSEYNAVSTQQELSKLRVAVSGVVGRLDEESPEYKRLREADERAAERVAKK